ncbi:MAG: hypothetical protein ABSC37_17855, partial [Xanthobacteraceae bacterium]
MFRISFHAAVAIVALLASITASAQTGAPDACPSGLVWREASPGDRVCVTPETRAKARTGNIHSCPPGRALRADGACEQAPMSAAAAVSPAAVPSTP